MKKYLSISCICLLILLFSTCKKYNPDCATCPCPACPIITQAIPNHGRTGDTLILSGANFHSETGLNRVYIGTVAVEEIIEGTNNQLIVIVPEISSSGEIKIKINDEKGLSSEEIPDYNAPIFTVDHFVELVAGTPMESGYLDDHALHTKFNDLSKISYDNICNCIYLLDNYTQTFTNFKSVRKVEDENTTTIFTSNTSTITTDYIDITQGFNQKIYLLNKTFPSNSTANIQYLENGNLSNFLSIDSDEALFRNFGSVLTIDQNIGQLYYNLNQSTPISTSFIIKKSLNNNQTASDTLASITPTSQGPKIDIEYVDGFLYYYKNNVANGSWQLIKKAVNPSYNEIVLKDNIITPGGIAVDNVNRVYYSSGNRIYRINNTSEATIIAGAISAGYNSIENIGIYTQFNSIKDIDFDNANNLYIVDAGNFCIRRLKIE